MVVFRRDGTCAVEQNRGELIFYCTLSSQPFRTVTTTCRPLVIGLCTHRKCFSEFTHTQASMLPLIALSLTPLTLSSHSLLSLPTSLTPSSHSPLLSLPSPLTPSSHSPLLSLPSPLTPSSHSPLLSLPPLTPLSSHSPLLSLPPLTPLSSHSPLLSLPHLILSLTWISGLGLYV